MTTAWLVLGEVPTPAEVTGGLLLLAGVATAVLRPWHFRGRESRPRAQRRGEVRAGGLPEDVANVVTFLASPGAAALSGAVVRVCGGSFLGA